MANRNAIDNVRYSALGADGKMNKAATPSVGIFWGIGSDKDHLCIVNDKTPLSEAETYGDFLTHAGGHFEFWEKLRKLSIEQIVSRGLPPVICGTEYEDFPRGRVVFNTTSRVFTIYADRRLQRGRAIHGVANAFALIDSLYTVRSDEHYRRLENSNGSPDE